MVFILPSRCYFTKTGRDTSQFTTKSYMDFRFVQNSMTMNDLERSKRILAMTGKHEVIYYGRNVRLVLVCNRTLQLH